MHGIHGIKIQLSYLYFLLLNGMADGNEWEGKDRGLFYGAVLSLNLANRGQE
jgi:hypothetical protein